MIIDKQGKSKSSTTIEQEKTKVVAQMAKCWRDEEREKGVKISEGWVNIGKWMVRKEKSQADGQATPISKGW